MPNMSHTRKRPDQAFSRSTKDKRGLTVLHAGQKVDEQGWEFAAALGITLDRDLPTGCYLGVIELADCHFGLDCCPRWGERGVFHWATRAPRSFAEPIPGLGQLGIYRKLPRAVATAVREAGWA